MKKSFNYILLLPLLALAVVACNDEFLDASPQDKLSDASFWKTEKHAFDALTGVYSRLNEKGSIGNPFTVFITEANTMTDDAVGGLNSFKNGTLNSTTQRVNDFWKDFYSGIRACNVFLANIDQPEMDETLRKRYRAEVRYLRALFYSFLYNNWGGVPLVTEPLALSELDVPSATSKETYSFIVGELALAAADLPAVYASEDQGRATKGAALALKARIELYASEYEAAASSAKQVMDLGVYDLFQDEAGTGYYSLGQLRNEDNSEIIFAIKYQLPDHGAFNQTLIHPPGVQGLEGWGGYQLTKSFVDAFETTDGKTIDDPASIFDSNNEFDNRDPRLAMAVVKQGDTLPNGIPLDGAVVTDASYTGYYPRKAYFEEYVVFNRYDTDLILQRFAEVLLIYAEAKIELGQLDATVLEALNRIRARAYGVGLGDTGNYPAVTTTNQSELREIVRRERHVELGGEYGQYRLNDLRRWGIAENVLNQDALGALSPDGSGEYRFILDQAFDAGSNYLWPIPQEQIDLMGSSLLPQNPGY